MKETLRIAFYGKGGIGKSTIASNISAAFARQGKRVLHIGCDPKADSVRLLTEKRIPTILQKLEEKETLTREDMLYKGTCGVWCAEAGGPEAGRGCAGLGITTAMDELQRAGVLEEEWDVIVYDVLGDVVCGGFSVPMRQHFADRVYVVTSADYMALYAANNILKGVRRYSRGENSLFGGIILNHVRSAADQRIVNAFMKRTNTSLLTWIGEEQQMRNLDYRKMLLLDTFPDSENGRRLQQAAEIIKELPSLPVPTPMDPEEMEQFREQMAEELYEE